jgi:hypothetical protein
MSFEPKRIRIVQPGWIGYTGEIGSVVFEDGVSVNVVAPVFIDRIGAEIQVVDADTGELQGAQVRMIESRCIPLNSMDQLQRTASIEEVAKPNDEPPIIKETEEPEEKIVWTDEQLMAVADDKGINGLREIGNPIGAKGRSIPELISNILKCQDELRLQAEALLPRAG